MSIGLDEACLACLDGDHLEHDTTITEHTEKLEDLFCVCNARPDRVVSG